MTRHADWRAKFEPIRPRPIGPLMRPDRHGGDSHALTIDQAASWSGWPLVLVVGATTAGSLAHVVFDRWSELLGMPWTLRGVDLPADTPPRTYRQLVAALRDNPAVSGAVVTAHKRRLYRTCAPDLTRGDRLLDVIQEVNTLVGDTVSAAVTGYARDALSLTYVLPKLVRHAGAHSLGELHVLCLGAGSAATALLLALHTDTTGRAAVRSDAPAHTIFADTNPEALDDLRAVAERAAIDSNRVSFVQVATRAGGDLMVAHLPARSLVVNATGLGKDSPGSPLTDRAPFRPTTVAWDLNYRGQQTFLRQATTGRARTVNGWDYFVAGWAGCLTGIAGIPFTADMLARFARAAAPFRPREA